MNQLPNWTAQGYRVLSELDREGDSSRIVYLATRGRKTNRKVSVKYWRFGQGASWQGFEQLDWEIRLLQDLDHPRILKYLDRFETESGVALVQEYRQVSALKERLSFDVNDIYTIARNTLELLDYLHQRLPPVIYRDLRPRTLLVNRQNLVYLRDFQWAQLKGNPANTRFSGQALM
jgi:serine/threonine protein kinase